MEGSLFALIPLLAPILLSLYAGFCLQRQAKTLMKRRNTEAIGITGMVIALISAILVVSVGTIESGLIGFKGLGFSIRLDALSVTFLTMISILGYVILRFSSNYLDGDPRRPIFFSRLLITIASVEMLILSGNLFQILVFWIITSVCLHYLLVFYRNRPQAIAAARKKFILARIGDVTLFTAIAMVYLTFGTGDLGAIFTSMEAGTSEGILGSAAFLLVLTALLKSAQFPTHGWLIEVVETPTPVSALLHAGLLNAGPYLMVRLSHLIVDASSASILLIVVGGFTALFASIVYMTQPSIKVSLGYSSVAHMGFSLLLCGLGVYSAAVLHVVAHSFYKAHAFLSSGSAVDMVKLKKVAVTNRKGNIGRIVLSIISATIIYLAFCYVWGINLQEDFSLVIIGSIIVMGLSQFLSATFDAKATKRLVLITGGWTLLVALSFFTLEHFSRELLGIQIPQLQTPSNEIQTVAMVLASLYALAIIIQMLAPRIGQTNFGYRWGIHLRNGLYANVIFDRMIGSLKHEKFKWVNLTVKEDHEVSLKEESEERLIDQQILTN